jgi:metallo-beta-lactamase class B
MRTRARRIARPVLATLLAVGSPTASASDATTPPTPATVVAECDLDASAMDGWDTPAPPRRIFGNTWYVGTCGIAVLLVTSDQGHVLIDGGTEAAPPIVLANIRALGFEPSDVKLIVASHMHHDHVGGLAALQAATGAQVKVRAPALAAARRGKGDRSDPQFLESTSFTGVPTASLLAEDGVALVGTLELKAHATPGHTPGGTSWTWRSCEGERCLDMAYVDSLSAISDDEYRFVDHPDDVSAFRAGIDRVAALPCDLLVTPHPIVSNLFARLRGAEGANMVETGACVRLAESARARLDARLAEEKMRRSSN